MTLLLLMNLGFAMGDGTVTPPAAANKTPASPRVAGAMKTRG